MIAVYPTEQAVHNPTYYNERYIVSIAIGHQTDDFVEVVLTLKDKKDAVEGYICMGTYKSLNKD